MIAAVMAVRSSVLQSRTFPGGCPRCCSASGSSHPDVSRVCLAIVIIVALSMASASIWRWLPDLQFVPRSWPALYPVMVGSLLGACLFVHDVIRPLAVEQSHRRQLCLALAAPGALATWSLASALWSSSPTRTPTEALLMTFVLATSVWFGFALCFHQQVLSLFVAFHLLVFASLGLSLTERSARFGDGSWMGLFSNPNLLGPVATFGIIAACGLRLWSSSVVVRLASSACIAADILVAIKATSATSWIALLVGATSICIVRLSVVLRSRGVSIGTPACRHASPEQRWEPLIVARSSRSLASLAGRDTSFTARRDVWEFVVDVVRQRPFTGYGFASFWDDPDNIANQYDRIGRLGAFAHSTFLEALLYLGAIGLGLLIVVVLFSLGRTWWTALGDSSIGRWPGGPRRRCSPRGESRREHDPLPLDLLGSTRRARFRRPPPARSTVVTPPRRTLNTLPRSAGSAWSILIEPAGRARPRRLGDDRRHLLVVGRHRRRADDRSVWPSAATHAS